jgi:TonB family protein
MKTTTRSILSALLGFAVAAHLAAQPSVPPDSPVKMHAWDMPFFPTQLAMGGIVNGELKLAIEVDATGRLTDTLVVAYTDEALARPSLAAVRKWTFDPAIVNGEPRSSTSTVVFSFRPDGPVLVESPNSTGPDPYLTQVESFGEQRFQYEVSELRDLDRIPAPVHIVKPTPGVRPDKASGPARIVVDFYIDEKGRVRMPSVSRDQDNALGWAAVQAVAQWQFVPPTVNGTPVTAHARQEFVFKP